MAKAKSSIPRSVTADPPADRWAILTQIAFLLSLMLVVARATMLEAGGEPAPGPRQAGPATSLMLDLLCCLPMLLVLARRMLDPTYVLRGSVSLVLSAGLAGWMLFSGIWASDRYTAVVSAAHFAAGMALLASTVQLVRSWQRLRIIAAVMFGLLAYLTAFGAYYKLVEAPDLQHEWTKWYCPVHTHEISTFPRSCPVCGREMVQTRLEEFKRHNWARDSFSAQQFEKKIMGGEVMGFSASPNTYGAVLALLITIGLGLIVQRVVEMRRGEGAGFDYSRFDYSIVFLATALIPAGVMIYFTGSKAAGIAPVLGAGVLAVIGRMRGALAARARARARQIYWAAVGAVALGIAAVVGHGWRHGSLPGGSLTFRWYYWVGAARILKQHALLGTGWSNFGLHYLRVRLPIASEEPKDPHNLLVRFFVELGIVGGILAVAWLGRLWWEMTRPIVPAAPAKPSTSRIYSKGVLVLSIIVFGGMVINAVSSIDWSQEAAYVLLLLMQKLMFSAAMLLAAVIASIRSLQDQALDERPAPWVLYGLLVGVGLFFVQNLIDFSFFEIGPMLACMVVLGGVLGVRLPTRSGNGGGKIALRPRWMFGAGFAAALLAWLLVAALFVVPVADAEEMAQTGENAEETGNPALAAQSYQYAFERPPVGNSEYGFRAARELIGAGANPAAVRAMLETAIKANPMAGDYYLTRAEFELRQPGAEAARVRADFERAMASNPNNVALRLRYGEVLQGFGDRRAAAGEYRAALRLNEQLAPDEAKRMEKQRVAEIERKIAELER